MILDFYHNKIVSDTVSEAFRTSFSENLLPKLKLRFGESLLGVQMYEDFISDRLILSDFAYYPLTVILDSGFEIVWIRWSVENAADFSGGIPYSYLGDATLDFEIVNDVPSAFIGVTVGRRMYFDGGTLPIHISTVIDSVKLSGKYSQSFLDELSVAVCREIEGAMAVSGLSKTGIRLEMPFAPETYMEHTSDNVTYRRILISDKTSSAKDLWIKWTRLDSAVGYSVSDNVSSENIVFELGEDVPQKVREKEYRFLTRISAAKYQTAMGRKNVTEWRELIKRAVKRGELVRRELPEENEAESVQMNDELDRILEKIGYTAPSVPKPEPTAAAPDDELLRAIQLAELTVMGKDEDAESEELAEIEALPETEELAEIETLPETDELAEIAELPEVEELNEAAELPEASELSFMPEGLTLELEATAEPAVDEDDDTLPWEDKPAAIKSDVDAEEAAEEADGADEEAELDDEGEFGESERDILEELLKLDSDEEAFDALDLKDEDSDVEVEDEECEPITDAYASATCQSRAAVEVDSPSEDALREIKAERAELENSLRLRIEEEIEKRRELEGELSELLRERDKLANERDGINALYEKTLAEKLRAEELHQAEKQQLLSEITSLKQADERERYRLAEAAKLEIEERRRLTEEAERAELERRRLAEEQMRRLEEERLEAERAAERERWNREAAAEKAAPAPVQNLIYTSYVVRLLFRHSVDPNSINQIGELIKTTVAYYKKDELKIYVKASLPDSMTVQLDFTNIPEGEHELIVNIIKVLGNSNLGIAKAILD